MSEDIVKPDMPHLADTLEQFTRDLVEDLRLLRNGEITLPDARVRAQLAREVLRSANLQFEGLKFFAENAKQLAAPESTEEEAAP